jgi:hypothetical protein
MTDARTPPSRPRHLAAASPGGSGIDKSRPSSHKKQSKRVLSVAMD